MIIYKLIYFTLGYCVLFLFKLFYRLKVYGKNHVVPGGAIIASNHVSFFDPPLIAVSCITEELHFLARHTLFKSSLGKIFSYFNAHPIRQNAMNSSVIKQVDWLLSQGKKILIFPEGKRSRDNQLQEIQPGIGMLASKGESTIIPTYIHGAYDVWNCHRRWPKLFGKIVVVFGAPILWSDYADMDKKEAQKLIVQRLAHSLNELSKWYEDGARGLPP